MTLSVNCPNDECGHEINVNTDDFDNQSEPSGNHTTQYLEEGSVICPKCKCEFNVEVLSDLLDDTG